jgi:hypothetical protein
MLELCYIGRLDFLALHRKPEPQISSSARPSHLVDAAEARALVKARLAKKAAAKSAKERGR